MAYNSRVSLRTTSNSKLSKSRRPLPLSNRTIYSYHNSFSNATARKASNCSGTSRTSNLDVLSHPDYMIAAASGTPPLINY